MQRVALKNHVCYASGMFSALASREHHSSIMSGISKYVYIYIYIAIGCQPYPFLARFVLRNCFKKHGTLLPKPQFGTAGWRIWGWKGEFHEISSILLNTSQYYFWFFFWSEPFFFLQKTPKNSAGIWREIAVIWRETAGIWRPMILNNFQWMMELILHLGK